MKRRGRYYLGRVVKTNIKQNDLMDAIANAPIITVGKFDWAITDILDNRNESLPYIFGKLSKYAKDGQAKVIDEINRSQINAEVPNLLEASSPFIYLPEYSGIAFLHVWNGIHEDTFPRRFKSIIEAAFDNFMISCDVEPISDYRGFTSRLKRLSSFTEISATVYPPNPLFGRLWKSLNNYISERNASEIAVKEQTSISGGLHSQVIELMDKIIESPNYEPDEIPAIGDAAILMAADGYGRGKVVGVEDGSLVEIKTKDNQKNFLYEKDPDPDLLAETGDREFRMISKERDMRH